MKAIQNVVFTQRKKNLHLYKQSLLSVLTIVCRAVNSVGNLCEYETEVCRGLIFVYSMNIVTRQRNSLIITQKWLFSCKTANHNNYKTKEVALMRPLIFTNKDSVYTE